MEGDYYPAADYDALEAKLAQLVEVVEGGLSWLSSYPGGGAERYYDKLKAVIDAVKKSQPVNVNENDNV